MGDNPLVKQAKEVDLGRLKDFECYKAIDENDPFIKDAIRITTKWENTWKFDSVPGQWACKARFVAREFKWAAFRNDLCTPASGFLSSRCVDYVAIRNQQKTLVLDGICAFLHVE